jgi:demethylmenaquinone methyltransferase/2-methoxy-6-polyprenyl-1,4-benzoquinol methylase
MLDAGSEKFEMEGIDAICGDALHLPYGINEFDAAVVGFGIRNVADPGKAIIEMARVVRPGGRVVILEFSQPVDPVFKAAYDFHSKWIMPRIGEWISGRSEAYTYLPESVKRWKTRDEMSELLHAAGLVSVRCSNLTFGVVCVHVGEKPVE